MSSSLDTTNLFVHRWRKHKPLSNFTRHHFSSFTKTPLRRFFYRMWRHKSLDDSEQKKCQASHSFLPRPCSILIHRHTKQWSWGQTWQHLEQKEEISHELSNTVMHKLRTQLKNRSSFMRQHFNSHVTRARQSYYEINELASPLKLWRLKDKKAQSILSTRAEKEIAEERKQLEEDESNLEKPWKMWGPYLSDRQWGTVREDYSEDGNWWVFSFVFFFTTKTALFRLLMFLKRVKAVNHLYPWEAEKFFYSRSLCGKA